MTSLESPEFWRFWRTQEKGQKEARKRPEEARKRPEEARKRPGKGQKRPGRGQKRHQKARNPEFGENLFDSQCFMNRK